VFGPAGVVGGGTRANAAALPLPGHL